MRVPLVTAVAPQRQRTIPERTIPGCPTDPVLRHKLPPRAVARYLALDLAKMRHMVSLPFYVTCVALLFVLVAVHRVSFFTSTATLYYSRRGGEILGSGAFLASTDFAAFFPWLRTAAASAIATASSEGPNRVMSTVALREIRLEEVPCATLGFSTASMDPLTQLEMLNNSCVGNPHGTYAPSFGPGNFPLRSTVPGLKGFSHTADFHDIGIASHEYVVMLNLSKPESVAAQIDQVEAGGWIDRFTSCLCVDFVVFYSDSSLVVVSSFILERTTTGLFSAETFSGTFRLFSDHRGLIAIDAIIFLFAVVLVAFLVFDVRERFALRVLRPNASIASHVRRVVTSIGMWELFTLAITASTITVIGLRFRLWSVSEEFDASGGEHAFSFAVSLLDQYTLIYNLYCASLVLAALRLFSSFRYIAGLSKITQALRRTMKDLARVGVVYAVLLAVVTISACMLYSDKVRGMRTFFHALSFLLVMLISASLSDDDYSVMRENAGFLTDVYLVLIGLIFWLLLLNLAIAIISSAFIALDEDDEAGTDGVWDLITIYVTFTHPQYYEVDRIAHRINENVAALPPSRRLAHHNARRLVPLRQRFRILAELRRWRMASYLEFASRAVKGRQEYSLVNAVELCAVHQGILKSSHFQGQALLYRLFRTDQKVSGAVMQAVEETSDLQSQILHKMSALQRFVKFAVRELQEPQRNLAPLAPGARWVSTPQDSRRTAPAPSSLLPVPSGSVSRLKDDIDVDALLGMTRLNKVQQRRRAASIAAEKSFSIGEEGDVAELDSASDLSSNDDLFHQPWTTSSSPIPPSSHISSILKAHPASEQVHPSRRKRKLRFVDGAAALVAARRLHVVLGPAQQSDATTPVDTLPQSMSRQPGPSPATDVGDEVETLASKAPEVDLQSLTVSTSFPNMKNQASLPGGTENDCQHAAVPSSDPRRPEEITGVQEISRVGEIADKLSLRTQARVAEEAITETDEDTIQSLGPQALSSLGAVQNSSAAMRTAMMDDLFGAAGRTSAGEAASVLTTLCRRVSSGLGSISSLGPEGTATPLHEGSQLPSEHVRPARGSLAGLLGQHDLDSDGLASREALDDL